MKVRWSRMASSDLAGISRYIRQFDPAAAKRVGQRIKAAAERLSCFPELGRIGSVEGTREKLALPYPYLIIYEIETVRSEIWILRVYHTSQNRP